MFAKKVLEMGVHRKLVMAHGFGRTLVLAGTKMVLAGTKMNK